MKEEGDIEQKNDQMKDMKGKVRNENREKERYKIKLVE